MSKNFEIIKKKNLPDDAQIKGFTFLKEPTKEDKENKKFDFTAFSNGSEIGCMLSKRSSFAFSKGYVKLDTDLNNYAEVKTRFPILLILLLGICLISLLCFKFCDASPSELDTSVNQGQTQQEQVEQPPQGNFSVGGKQDKPVVEEEPEEVEYITFSGFGKYEVSSDAQNVELSNPDGNFVDMIFTLTDKSTGDVIARTGKVHPGEYVYVNVMEYYKTQGNYFVTVNIETMNEDNVPMNGLNQEMEIVVN